MNGMSVHDEFVYTSQVFGRSCGSLDEPTLIATYAECCLDPLGQPVVWLVDWFHDGATPRYAWGSIGTNFIRYDEARHVLEQVEVLHDLSPGVEIIRSWELDEQSEEELKDAAGDGDLERALFLTLEITSHELGLRTLSPEMIDKIDERDDPEFNERLVDLGLMAPEALSTRAVAK